MNNLTIREYFKELPLKQLKHIMMECSGEFPPEIITLAAEIYIYRYGENTNLDILPFDQKKDSPD